MPQPPGGTTKVGLMSTPGPASVTIPINFLSHGIRNAGSSRHDHRVNITSAYRRSCKPGTFIMHDHCSGDNRAMPPNDPTSPPDPPAPGRLLPVLLVLFVGSGCAALIYEVVWLQLLRLVIGSTAVSLGVLLGTFMGGMCLGSLLLPRLVSSRWHPLRVYAVLELGIGAIGLAVLFGMPYVENVYTRYAGHGLPGILLRGAVAGVCLLPPTLLMGATLPAMRAGSRAAPRECHGWAFFTAATSPAPCLAVCWPAFTCCASTTWRRPLTSPAGSM